MANRTNWISLILSRIGLWLALAAIPAAAYAGGCNCVPPPPSPPVTPPSCCAPPSPPPVNNCCAPVQNIVVPGVNVYVAASVQVNVQANAAAQSTAAAQGTTFVGGGSGAAGYVAPGPVSAVNLDMGGGERREAYEAERVRIEKVVIQAFCFDDMDVPHPASQVGPERDIDEAYDGEIYRCIAGSHMQVTIAQWKEAISFEGGQTLTCQKGEALYHVPGVAGPGGPGGPGQGGGSIECRPQKPARDCNERSLLRRFGAGIKVLTLVIKEKYTAYREESTGVHTTQVMSLDGGVGGVMY
ncbi:MAG TPA: hypothetical protein VGL58_08370 [Caulobacteraceae bacterium]|jgi:hypothetical protein